MTKKGIDKLSTTDSVLSFLAMYMPATAGLLFWLFVSWNSPLAHRLEPVSSHDTTVIWAIVDPLKRDNSGIFPHGYDPIIHHIDPDVE